MDRITQSMMDAFKADLNISIDDVRVQSDNPEYVYEVLDTLLNTDR